MLHESVKLNKKLPLGSQKFYKWILRDTYRWVKLSKPLTDGG